MGPQPPQAVSPLLPASVLSHPTWAAGRPATLRGTTWRSARACWSAGGDALCRCSRSKSCPCRASPRTRLVSDVPPRVRAGTEAPRPASGGPFRIMSSDSVSASLHEAFLFFTLRGFGLPGWVRRDAQASGHPAWCECGMAIILMLKSHMWLSVTHRWPPAPGLPCDPGAVGTSQPSGRRLLNPTWLLRRRRPALGPAGPRTCSSLPPRPQQRIWAMVQQAAAASVEIQTFPDTLSCLIAGFNVLQISGEKRGWQGQVPL